MNIILLIVYADLYLSESLLKILIGIRLFVNMKFSGTIISLLTKLWDDLIYQIKFIQNSLKASQYLIVDLKAYAKWFLKKNLSLGKSYKLFVGFLQLAVHHQWLWAKAILHLCNQLCVIKILHYLPLNLKSLVILIQN